MSMHAMMTLNLCFESYGAAVHVMDALMGVSAEQVRRPLRQTRQRSSVSRTPRPAGRQVSSTRPDEVRGHVAPAFVDQVRDATERMPFDQAYALWLVDVCGCSYEKAATEAHTSRRAIADRVACGRRFIRAALAVEPSPAHVS